MDWGQIIIGLAITFGLIGSYFVFFLLNRKTKIPKGCELAYLEATCGACLNKSCEIQKEGDLIV